MLAATGVNIMDLPPHSSEYYARPEVYNPIENFFWELKAFVRRFSPKELDSIETLVKLSVFLNSYDYQKIIFPTAATVPATYEKCRIALN